MNALAHEIPVSALRSRPGAWAARAWRKMGWRHILLALLIHFVSDAIHPLGGVYFPAVEVPNWDPIQNNLSGTWLIGSLWVVYCVLVADEAFDEGVSALRAYGLAVVALAIGVPLMDRPFVLLFPSLFQGFYSGKDEGAAQLLWWSLVILYEGGFGLAIYGYWRVTQRAMRQVQLAETERASNEQRVQTARLLALQAQVDPQLLFGALGQVGILHKRDPLTADALLGDLISLLRSMQPGARQDSSTIEQEFWLVEAWLRVVHSAGQENARVRLEAAPGSTRAGIAPMLILPLLRAALAAPHAMAHEWLLGATVQRSGLQVTLQSNATTEAPEMLAQADLVTLHERLVQLHGPHARLTISPASQSLTLDLPLLPEDSDDQSADR
jgi:hypothetical protein